MDERWSSCSLTSPRVVGRNEGMRLFGYYALHSFVNQIRKLCKTWVLVFIVVCMLFGGVIGIFAATLEDTVEANQEPQTLAEPQPEEESPPLSISPSALAELIAGGAVLALFFFEAVSADKNGSRIFLPADVNLLFPSPMKPQSVLMFRLATQLGTALIATIYIVFQLPNLMLNLGLSGWGAAAILITWFSAVLIGKLLQVLLYTICSTHAGFKKNLRRCVYAALLLLAGSFLVFFKASGLDALQAADRFFNPAFSRWIPFWGWLKGLAVFTMEGSWLSAIICLGLLMLGCAAMVYCIWHINADFYEDAMAKSEETAALLERAKSEKTSGTAATGQRKKERKSSLRRDGLNHGWGASVYFHKTMYNRFRFAHFGFLTKTMETYLAAGLGIAAALRFYFDSTNPTAVVLALGVLVFFRAMGDPLAEDTGLDYFRMIPESTWQKLFYSLLGGTICCLLDLLPPLLGASAILMVNPLELLKWLPLIVSVDFYATSMVTFIDLSIPASIGKTIKQMITILFIYFGLLPDIGILAFGIVLGRTLPAALGATAVNLLLGVFAFSLASVFLQPKGKDISMGKAQDLRAARRSFSRVGFGVFTILLLVLLGQLGLTLAAEARFPQAYTNPWGIWLLTFGPQYLLAVPVGLLLLRRIPAHAPEKHTLGVGRGVKFGFICVFLMYTGNLVGTLVTTIAGAFQGAQVVNPLMNYITGDNLPAQILVIVILAPLVEEYVFRKQPIDRLGVYGGKTAVLLSALLFGLYHGNFSQFFYAFGLGLAFGYIYLNTGKLRYSVIAHMCINFMGSVFAPELLKRASPEAATMEENLLALILENPWFRAYYGYAALLICCALVGLVLLCMNARNLRFPEAALELPRGKRFRVAVLNAGMLLVILFSIALMVLSLAA